MEFEEIQQKTNCNWCRNLMIMSEPITDANFVQIEGKVMPNTGEPAYALYCSGCLADENRVKQPKSAIDKETLQEFNLEGLKDSGAAAKAPTEELKTENH